MKTKEELHAAEDKMKKTIESMNRNFAEVRTGRAHPGLVEGLHVDYYGTPTLIKQLNEAVEKTKDEAKAKEAKALIAEAQKLHDGGKHADSVMKCDDAAKVLGVKLKKKS